MLEGVVKFIQSNSPDGGFLQSEYWRKFQESIGRKTHNLSEVGEDGELIAYANIIEHKLPLAGKYFYVPRGPVGRNPKSEILNPKQCQMPNAKCQNPFGDLLNLAKRNNVGWIRVEPANDENLELIKKSLPKDLKIKKSAVDIQPREILVVDIAKSEEEILAGMKQKTRYNIRLSQKRGVSVKAISNFQFPTRLPDGQVSKQYIEEFLRLVEVTAERDKITSHPKSYYRKMFETIPPEILKLYVAEYGGKIIAANLALFFGRTATYMHGASDNVHRDMMAPYLLQWRQIRDAKKTGCERYDLGGVKTDLASIPPLPRGGSKRGVSWEGITRFKTGFAPNVEPIGFPGCYDIVLKPAKHRLYRFTRRLKKLLN